MADEHESLARRPSAAQQAVLEAAGIRLDPARHRVERDGAEVELAPKEFAVLEVLLRAEGGVVSAEQLLDRAWDEHADPFTNAVRVTIMTLRKRLGEPPVIETVVGAGYRIDGEATSPLAAPGVSHGKPRCRSRSVPLTSVLCG